MTRSLLALSALSLAAPGWAQTPAPAPAASNYRPMPMPAPMPGFRAPSPGELGLRGPTPAAIRYVDSYQQAEQTSRCVVAAAPGGGEAFWAARPGSLPERRGLADWARRAAGCYAAGFRAPLPLLRGALAEASLDAAPAPGPASAQRMRSFFVAEAQRRRGSAGNDRAVAALAACVAPLAQAQTRALLLTEHGTPAERRAMNRVLANGNSCVRGDWRLPSWAGTTFLRAYLAEATYRWSRFAAAG